MQSCWSRQHLCQTTNQPKFNQLSGVFSAPPWYRRLSSHLLKDHHHHPRPQELHTVLNDYDKWWQHQERNTRSSRNTTINEQFFACAPCKKLKPPKCLTRTVSFHLSSDSVSTRRLSKAIFIFAACVHKASQTTDLKLHRAPFFRDESLVPQVTKRLVLCCSVKSPPRPYHPPPPTLSAHSPGTPRQWCINNNQGSPMTTRR